MPKIRITDAALHAIAGRALYPFKDTSTSLGNGIREIEVDDEVFERLLEKAFNEEDLSDTILRLCSTHKQ